MARPDWIAAAALALAALALCAQPCAARWRGKTPPPAEAARIHAQHALEFETCSHQRVDAVACALRFGDLDGDARISPAEIDTLKRHYLSTMMRVGAWVAEKIGAESTETIMQKCDYDEDGFISASDFEASIDTCLAACSRVNMLFDIICNHAIEEERMHARARLGAVQ